jgi:hypothetical protein
MTANDDRLTIEDIASVTDEAPEEVGRWRWLGLLDDEPLTTAAIERVRLAVRSQARRTTR